MRILVFVFLVLVLTQRVSADEVIDLRSHLENYQITEGGEYHFTTNGELWEYGIIATAQDEITIILEDVNIKSVSPIDCNKAKDVYVIIKGSNILDNSYQDRIKAAISAPANVNGQLVINGTNNDDLMITATYGACIGWDNYEPIHGHNSSRLVINGGRYLLQSYFGAGIGASQESVFGHIIVNGGIINSSSCYGMGIGIDGTETLPDNPMETQITIHGGTITAHSDIYYGIGDPCNKNKAAYFYSSLNGVPGNAFVISNGIELLNTQVQAEYIGVFFTDEQTKVGRVYGKPVLSTDAEIPEGYTLEVCSDEVLTVAEGTKLTNSGSLEINSGGSFVNNGNLIINGSVENKGTIINNGNITIYDNKEDVVIDGIQFYDISFDPNGENVNGMPIKISTTSESNVQVAINTLPTRDGYLFVGWSISPDAKEAVYIDNKFEIKISNESVKLYAIWKSNIFNVDSSKEIEMNYGDDLYLLDLSTLVSCIDEKVDFFPVVSYELVDNTIDGVSLEDNLLIINSSIMKVGSAYEIKIKFSNGISSSDKTATVGLKIEPRKLRIIYPEIEVLYSDEVEKFKSSIQFGGAKEGEVPAYNHDKFAEKDGVLSLKSIELVNNELFIASNYTIDYKELVDIKIIQNIASEQNVSITYGSKGNNGWYTSDIKIECPEGFTIEGEKVALKDASSKIDLIISEEGNYDFEYTIKSFSHSKTDKLSVALDKTGPIVDLTTKNYTSATFTIMDNVSGIASYETLSIKLCK